MRLKKIITLILIISICVTTVSFAPAANAQSDYSMIKIRISIGNVTSLALTLNGKYFIQETGMPISSTDVTVKKSGSSVAVIDKSGNTIASESKVTLMRIDDQGGSAGTVKIYNNLHGWRNYLGHFIFTVKGDYLYLVNYIPIENYLYGVVAHEMSDSWPVETLKAQAVAARGYAIQRIKKTSTYDLTDTSSDQVYKGYTAAYTNVRTAVDGTRGVVMTNDGKIISAYYAASNGGQTISNVDAWGSSALAYLPRKDDPYDVKNPLSPIQKTLVPFEVSAATPLDSKLNAMLKKKVQPVLQQMGYNVLADQFSIVGCNEVVGKAPKHYSSSRNYTTYGFNLKVRLDTGTPAANPTPTPAVVNPTPTVSMPVSGVTMPTIQYIEGVSDAVIISNGGTFFPELTGVRVSIEQLQQIMQLAENYYRQGLTAKPSTQQTLEGKDLQARAAVTQLNVSVDVNAADFGDPNTDYCLFKNTSLRMYTIFNDSKGFYIARVRYGHGVGMSQRGAQQMGNEGLRYTDILNFYYSNIRLDKLDVEPDPVVYTAPSATGTGTQAISDQVKAKTNSSSAKLYAQPSSKAKATSVKKGTTMVIGAKSGSYYSVKLSNGSTGYVLTKYVTITNFSSGKIVGKVNSSNVSIRDKESTSGKRLGYVNKGDLIVLKGLNKNFYKITLSTGKTGYVSASYVDIVFSNTDDQTEATPTPVVTPNPDGTMPTPAPVQQVPGKVYGQTLVASTLYSKAGTASEELATIPANAVVEVVSQTSDKSWYKVVYNAMTGYIAQSTVRQPLGSIVQGSAMANGEFAKTSKASHNDILSQLALSSMYADAYAIPRKGTVSAQDVAFRQADTTTSQKIAVLKKNTAVSVIEKMDDWCKIEYGGRIGYMSSKYVTVSSKAAGEMGYINTSGVNMRAGASASATLLRKFENREKVCVISQNNGYYKVIAGDEAGYVSKEFVIISPDEDQADPAQSAEPSIPTDDAAAASPGQTGTSTPAPSQNTGTGEKIYAYGEVYNVDSWAYLCDVKNVDNKIGQVPLAAKVEIYAATTAPNGKKYYRITYNGKMGLISTNYVKVVSSDGGSSSSSLKQGQLTASVKLRSSKSTSSTVQLSLVKGDLATIVKDEGTWIKIKVLGITGYVEKKYVKSYSDGVSRGMINYPQKAVPFYKAATGSSSYGTIAHRKTVIVLGTSGDRTKVKFGDQEGYVATKYIVK